MKKFKNPIIGGALSLGVGAFFAKLIGAIYRVPLTNMLGGWGLGLYQMVFPVYSLLLDFSGAGLPSALSRLISVSKIEDREKRAHTYLISSIKLFLILGVLATLFMAIFSLGISKLQGDINASKAYLALAPAVISVSLISCLRGYFQGLMNMNPTAVSQIVEQIVKLIAGLSFARLFLPDIPSSVAGATLGISLSELVALIYLIFVYKKRKKTLGLNFNYEKGLFIKDAKTIIKTTVPITLVGIMIPLSQVIDSFLVVNLLSAYTSDATALYGLLSGAVMTVINLPVSICYGFSTVAIPAVSECKSIDGARKKGKKILALTLIFSLPCALFLLLFAPFSISLLFGRLPAWQKQTAINLLRLCSPCVVLLSLVQASNAVLIGSGKLYTPVINLLMGVAVKTVLNIILLRIPEFNVYGGAVAIIACYFVVCLVNLIVIFKRKVAHENKATCRREFAS